MLALNDRRLALEERLPDVISPDLQAIGGVHRARAKDLLMLPCYHASVAANELEHGVGPASRASILFALDQEGWGNLAHLVAFIPDPQSALALNAGILHTRPTVSLNPLNLCLLTALC